MIIVRKKNPSEIVKVIASSKGIGGDGGEWIAIIYITKKEQSIIDRK